MSIDERVSTSQVQKAVKSLSTYTASKKKEKQESGKVLFDEDDENVWLVVTTKTMSPSLTLKPQRIPLAHPIIDPRISSICLITKDPQRAYKDLLQNHSIKFISRVVGISKLKGKFSPYDARRQLAGEHGLFLADERIIPLLPTLLGKAFFKKKKQPIPVNLLKKDLKFELESAISSTYMHQNAGTCVSIKIGHTGMDAHKLLANVEKSIPSVVRKLHHVSKRRKNGEKQVAVVKESMKSDEEKLKDREESWENIQSLGIKTHSSVCLPIWSCALNDRWIASVPPVTPTPSSSKSTLKNGASTKSKLAITVTKGGDDDDDTMSEGDDDGDEKRLSDKLAKSSLNGSKKRTAEESQAYLRKQKKRKADDGGIEETALATTPVAKKSKKGLIDSVPSTNHTASLDVPAAATLKTKKDRTLAAADAPPSSRSSTSGKKGPEKSKKSDRAKAADFMEEDTPSVVAMKESTANVAGKKDGVVSSSTPSISTPFTAADASLKVHKERKRAESSTAGEKDAAAAVSSMKASAPTPLATAEDINLKAQKKDKKRDKAPMESLPAAAVETASLPTATKVDSKSTSGKPSSAPLKSAMKSSSTSLAVGGLTLSELSEKKAKKATFSVMEKKKEKMGKSVVGIASGGKSGKGGKSKMSLVGRGPKM